MQIRKKEAVLFEAAQAKEEETDKSQLADSSDSDSRLLFTKKKKSNGSTNLNKEKSISCIKTGKRHCKNMANVTQISLESLLLRATNPNNANLETAAIEAFFVLVNKERDGPAVGVKVLASRLPVGTEKEVLSTLNVLDMCMSKCGTPFQSEVGKFRFLNEMIKLVSPKYLGSKTPLSVKQRVLQLLYLWTLDYPKEIKIKEAFDMLRKQGVIREIPNPNIPQEALGHESKKRVTNSIFQDEEKSNILRKLLQSKDPEDIQAANWLIKSMVKEDEKLADLKSKAVTELESVQNNLRLLNEMMGSYKKGITTTSELDLMKELHDNLVRLTPNLTAIACETEHCPVDLVDSVMKTMDDLTECCNKYKTKILEQKPDTSQSNLVSLMELDQQAVSSKASSFIQIDQHREIKRSMDDCSCSSQNGSQTSHLSSTSSKSPIDVLCDVFSGLGDVAPSSEILQPVAVSSNNIEKTTERDKEKHSKLKALEDLDVLGEHLLKENLPSSNYRHQEKIPMNLLTKINEIKLQQLNQNNSDGTQTPNESLKLDLNYLLDNPKKDESNLSQTSCKSDENLSQVDSTDDCLVDISEDGDKVSEKVMDDIKVDKVGKESQQNGDLASEIIRKLNHEKGGESTKLSVKEEDGKSTKVNSSAPSTNLKDIIVKLEDIKPSSKKSIVALDEKNGLTVLLHLAKDRPRPGVSVYVVTTISRNEMPLSNYYFQAVVPKGCKLKLQTPSATELPAFNPFLPPAAITQIMLIAHTDKSDIPLKYVISYLMDDDTVTEMGEVENMPLSESSNRNPFGQGFICSEWYVLVLVLKYLGTCVPIIYTTWTAVCCLSSVSIYFLYEDYSSSLESDSCTQGESRILFLINPGITGSH